MSAGPFQLSLLSVIIPARALRLTSALNPDRESPNDEHMMARMPMMKNDESNGGGNDTRNDEKRKT